MAEAPARRALLTLAAGALVLPAGCTLPAKDEDPKSVTAVEDLMREHGVLRRVLAIYDELAERLRMGDAGFDAAALAEACGLFRDFGEDYHERMLEETYIFPRVMKAGGPAAAMVDVLRDQHERGREITAYVQQAAKDGRIGAGAAEPLQRALRSMVVMYQTHAAREDTVVFPAWKAALSGHELQEMGETFEQIEKKMFRGDGFDQAEAQVGRIERRLGLAELSRFTAPAPPPLDRAAAPG
jgi:hemerythrin-like domain-containing protein